MARQRPDKNSSLAKDFISGLKTGIDIIPQSFSSVVFEPTLGLMVPGSNEEERQQIKSDIADKDAIINEFQNNPAFVEEMQRINSLIPQKRGPEIAKLFNRYEALGMPTKTKMELLNQFREFFFGDSYDIHAAVASGEKGITDFRRPKEFVDYVFGILDVVDVAGLTTLASKGLSKGTQTLLQGLNKKDISEQKAKEIIESLPKQDQLLLSNERTKLQTKKNVNEQLQKINPKELFFSNPKNLKEFYNKKDLNSLLNLAGVIDNTPIDQLDKSLTAIIRENKFDNLLEGYNKKNMKSFVKKNLKKYNLVSEDKFKKLEANAQVNITSGQAERAIEVEKLINDAYEKGITFPTKVSMATQLGMNESTFNQTLFRKPELKAKVEEIVDRKPNIGGTTGPRKLFFSESTDLFRKKEDLNNYLRSVDNSVYQQINKLRKEGGYQTPTLSPFRLFQSYMYDKYRSIKQTTGNEKLTTKDFVENYLDDSDLKNFKKYANLELQRTNLTVAGREIVEELAKNPNYKPYLLNKFGKIDYAILRADKAHDIPLFVTRTEGSGRLKKVGRFQGAGANVEFIQPHFQVFNYLQVKLDPYANIIGDIINQKGLREEFIKKTDVKNISDVKTPSRRTPINKKLFNILEDYGYKPNLDKFNNQFELMQEVAGVIDGLYKDRLIRTVVPVTKKDGFKDNVIFGIENPKDVTINKKLMLGGERLKEILDYAVENKLKPSEIKDSAGYLKGFNQGGDVETETEDQSFLSKALETVGGLFVGQAEAAPVGKIFNLVGDAPTAVKQVDTGVKQITSDVIAPTLEKRYNILDENGRKVFQSKSMDDAQQKALRLGDLEGKEFKVEEIEIPVKVKKKKETSTALVPTVTVDNAIGTGNNKLFYSDLDRVINTPSGNITIKGNTVPANSVSMSAKEWHDWFRSNKVREGELYDSYIRTYLNKKGGFNRETNKFTNDEPITFAEIKELSDTSPTNYLQTVSYSDASGNLKYGNTGRQDGTINGSRVERVLWLDSKDIRGDIGSLPREIRSYEGHRDMRQVTDSDDFSVQGNKLEGEPYVVGWSLNSNRVATLNNKPIIVNVADEIQSDFLQKAATLKSKIKKDIRTLVQDRGPFTYGNQQIEQLYKKLDNIFRPMPATYAQLKKSLDELIKSDEIFQRISEMEIDDLTKQSFIELGEASKVRDKALATINSTIDNIDARELFPNIPLKDQKDWVDAIIKNDVYNAAKNRFSFDESGKLIVNNEAPAYYAVAPAKAVKAYRGGQGIELAPDNVDRRGQMVAYDMQYGGPNLNDHTGAHFTSNVEETLNRIAQNKSSKVEIGKVDFGNAGSAVDTFMIELTPDMLLPYKAYFNDGGLVKKSILYTPIVPLKRVLSPIGASRW
jgi:hypothetical protein